MLVLSLGVLVVPGWILSDSGQKQIDARQNEEAGPARQAFAQEAVACLPAPVQSSLAGAAGAVAPGTRATLAAMLQDGRLPTDPRLAGLACLHCGVEAEVRHVELIQNTGALVVRFQRCIETSARKFPLHNLFLGWWGLISFMMNVVAIPMNIVHWIAAGKLAPPSPDAVPPELTPDSLRRLRPGAAAIAESMVSGKDPVEVCRAAAKKYGVTPGQVLLLVTGLGAHGGAG